MKRFWFRLALLLALASPVCAAEPTQSIQFANISATTTAFQIKGGKYGFVVSATFAGGNVTLQMLAGDGVTWVGIASQASAGAQVLDLAPGQYRIAVNTATAVYVSITNVPY